MFQLMNELSGFLRLTLKESYRPISTHEKLVYHGKFQNFQLTVNKQLKKSKGEHESNLHPV